MTEFGFRIKSLRKNEGLTQKEFANKLFISQSYLSGIEKGNIIITDKLFRLICLEFGVNPQWLNSGEGEMYEDVFENEPENLYKTSNKMMLELMQMLSTQSNTEYGHITYSFQALINILKYSQNDTSDKIEYLATIEQLLADIERFTSILTNREMTYLALENHIKKINEDLNLILKSCNFYK